MDPRRRRFIASLALAAVPSPAWPGAGIPAVDEPANLPAIPLRAAAGSATSATSLRYGDGHAVLRTTRGVPLRLGLDNGLDTATSLDLHGVRVPPPLGGAGPVGGLVRPGASAEIGFTPPDAGTFWFHPWITDPAVDATAQGLAGALIVAEETPPDVDADVVVLLSDRWPPTPSGSPSEAFRIGGDLFPRHETLRPGSRARLRLINGSTRQAITIACRGAAATVVAIDGQPSAPFRPRGDAVPLGPGARCDLIVDLPGTAGSEVSLSVGTPGNGPPALLLRTDGEPRTARGAVTALPPNPLLPAAIALERATRATLVATFSSGSGPITAWAINGVSSPVLPKAPLFTARRGTPVVLTVRNAGPHLVAFRVHGFCLRVLHDLDDGWQPYWADSVLVGAGATHHVAFVADLPGRWLIESPFFDQAAAGLKTWFEVR